MLNYLSSPLPLPARPPNLTLMYQALFSTLLGCVEVLEVSHLDPSSLSVGGTQQCGSQINSLRSSALVRSCAQSLRGQRNRRVPGELSPLNLIISGPLAQLAHIPERATSGPSGDNLHVRLGRHGCLVAKLGAQLPPLSPGTRGCVSTWGAHADSSPEPHRRDPAPMRTTGPALEPHSA